MDDVYYNKTLNRKLKAHEIWDHDLQRTSFFKDRGWTVCVLWENEIKATRLNSNESLADKMSDLVHERSSLGDNVFAQDPSNHL